MLVSWPEKNHFYIESMAFRIKILSDDDDDDDDDELFLWYG